MRKVLLLIIYSFFIETVVAQFECGVDESAKTSGDIPSASSYIPDSYTPMKILRVNIHFMLRENGDPDYPGNFTKYDDGNGNYSYTGYDYATELINTANSRLASNIKMNLPPYNTTELLSRKYKYVLNAVYFHESNLYYPYSQYTINRYAKS